MFRILVFSDNHRDREVVEQMLSRHQDIDRIFSLGDSEMPEHELSNLGIIGVRGNYPFEPKFPNDLTFEFLSVKILFTHGHTYNVKSGISYLYHQARSYDCQLVCYGHTHIYRIDDLGDVVLFNPGSLTYPKYHAKKTYGLISILKNQFQIDIIDVDSGNVEETYTKYL